MTEVTTSTMPTLKERYEDVRRRIAEAAVRSGRRVEDVHLLAVTKTASPEQIRELVGLGHADFAENRVQNLAKRVAALDEYLERHRTLTSSKKLDLPRNVRWHMIGHLQRNKVKKLLDLVTMIHSVDTLRLAEEIQDAGMKRDHPMDVLVQVNTSFEKSKYGCALPAVRHLAEQIDTMIHLRLRGVMAMAPLTEDADVLRATFERASECFEELRRRGVGGADCNLLSMGMTNDFELAIECGSNLVRIGSAIFGPPSEDEDAEDDEK